MPTAIQWCDETFNPWWGCERVSPACAHCYADDTAKFRTPGLQLWGADHEFRLFGDKHWEDPLRWARTLPEKLGRRPRIFCASMADVFEERDELVTHRHRLFGTISATPELDWLILTKRPEFMRDWLREYWLTGDEPLANVWLGVSIENARHTYRADVLREIPAAVRFISAEPLLGSLFVGPDRNPPDTDFIQGFRKPLDLTGIDWVIVGGESGTGARPCDLAWIREIRDATLNRAEPTMHQVPGGVDVWENERPALFVKQLGANPTYLDDLTIGVYKEKPLKLRDRKGGDIDEWPVDLRIREFPVRAAVLV